MGWRCLPVLVRLCFPPDLLFDLREMIIGIAEGIVDLGRRQMGIGLLDHLHRITGLGALVDQTHGDTGTHNNGIAAADRKILVDVAMFSLDSVGHMSIHALRGLCSQYQPISESSSQTATLGGGTATEPIPVTVPNDLDLPPGAQAELWYFDEAPDGSRPNQWAQYGTGTVSQDGSQIVPDIDPVTGKQFGQPRFCCGINIAAIIRTALDFWARVAGSGASFGGTASALWRRG